MIPTEPRPWGKALPPDVRSSTEYGCLRVDISFLVTARPVIRREISVLVVDKLSWTGSFFLGRGTEDELTSNVLSKPVIGVGVSGALVEDFTSTSVLDGLRDELFPRVHECWFEKEELFFLFWPAVKSSKTHS